MDCVMNYSSLAYIDRTTAHIWGAFTMVGKFEMHFPSDLLTDPNYTEEDLENLNVDDAWEIYDDGNGNSYVMIEGDYPVSIDANGDLVATVDVVTITE